MLLCCCIFAMTPYSVNPKQRMYKQPYDNLQFLYFTNILLYYTVLTSFILLIVRLQRRKRRLLEQKISENANEISPKQTLVSPWHVWMAKIGNFCLCMSPVCNAITTTVFWTCYAINPKLIVNKNSLLPGCHTYIITELSIHLFPLLISCLEQIDIKLTATKVQPISFLVLFVFWATAIHIAKHYKKIFLYKFLEMNIAYRILFFVGMYAFCMLFLQGLLFINRRMMGGK